MLQPRLVSYIRKRPVAIIFEQMRRRLLPSRKSLQPPSIHQKNIQPSVVVVIVKSYSTTRRLQQIFVFVLPAKNRLGIQPRFLSHIHKTQSQWSSSHRRSGRRGNALRYLTPQSLNTSRTRETQYVFE